MLEVTIEPQEDGRTKLSISGRTAYGALQDSILVPSALTEHLVEMLHDAYECGNHVGYNRL